MRENGNTVPSIKIALIGNPNSGKSTLFNALTGLHQKTGNFPGVTVDKKTGSVKIKSAGKSVIAEYIDLPGTYSLYPKSQDEQVATDVITDISNADHPELIIIVADATNLKRSLFLAGQIIDLEMPCILALNMMDEAEKAGIRIDSEQLSAGLGIPVVPVSARDKKGIDKLEDTIVNGVKSPSKQFIDYKKIFLNLPPVAGFSIGDKYRRVFEIRKKKENDEAYSNLLNSKGFNFNAIQAEESLMRYGVIAQHIEACVGKKQDIPVYSSGLDRFLTHKIFGYVFFLMILFAVFQSIFFLAEYPMTWIEDGFSILRDFCIATLPKGLLTDLFVNGILAGLSGVVVFIPQIALLFFFIAILEDSGYMARVSFIMDKLMRKIGLHGRSVIPLISGMACAVPAIMSTRTISNWKERLVTIMVTPLMSCSARLPVYTLLIAVVIPDKMVGGIFHLQGVALTLLYILGFVTAIISAWVIAKIVRTKEKSWFIMELPVYRIPKWSNVVYTIYDKVKVFLFDAGKVIITISILLWVLASYGPGEAFKQTQVQIATLEQIMEQQPSDSLDAAKKHLESKQLELSYAGRMGKAIEPAIKPLGYDWKMGISLITSLAAREVFVGTMATIYGAGDDENTEPIRNIMMKEKDPATGLPAYTFATGISLMIFYAFALQCISTIAIVKRETKSWKWPVIQFAFMGILAYLMSFLAYQLLS
ncbi:MAG: ferrous iron transport protein B [Bacteroidia bacterium]